MNDFVPLIEHTRGGRLECQHLGALAVVDRRGRLLAHAGNPHWNSFTRSTLKALQALPLVQDGGVRQFQFDGRDLAMMCASHNGEPMHVLQVQGMLDKIGQGYQKLECGCHVPLLYDYTSTPRPAALHYDERHNNCSGKHAGFLAWCVLHGAPTEGYIAPAHPLQQAVRLAVAQAVDMAPEELAMGIDGCSAPNYAMPLSRLALGYARLASGAADARFGESYALLSQAMTSHPELVSGTGRNDLALMRAGRGDWVSKIGADGVQALASKSRGEGFAIKVADASKPALYAATVALLDQLGWLDAAQREELAWMSAQPIINARGLTVGERRAVFSLSSGEPR